MVAFHSYASANTDTGGPNVSVYINGLPDAPQNGDIVQFKFPGASDYGHSAVVTGTYTSWYTSRLPLLTQHSSPVRDKKLEDYSYAEFRYIRINGYNQ